MNIQGFQLLLISIYLVLAVCAYKVKPKWLKAVFMPYEAMQTTGAQVRMFK